MGNINFKDVSKELNIMLGRKPRDGQKRNVVFWFDGEGEFSGKLSELEIDNTKVLVFDKNNFFNIKYELEVTDKASNYLIYAPMYRPKPEDNYLLDIYLYSQEFEADITTIYMRELGIKDPALFLTVKKYKDFLGNKERLNKLKAYDIADWSEMGVHIGVFCALIKSPFDFDYALISLISDYFAEGDMLDSVKKYCDTETLNSYIQKKFGLPDALIDMDRFITNMLLLHMSLYMHGTMPESWINNLPKDLNAAYKNNAYILIDRFMKSELAEQYDAIASAVAEKLNVQKYISGWDIECYEDVDTFIEFDRAIISRITASLVNKAGEFDKDISIIRQRRKSYWNRQLQHDYLMLHYAARFLSKMKEVGSSFTEISPNVMFENYAKSYFKFDQYYREFILHYDQSLSEELLPVYTLVDNAYTNWYLEELSVRWSDINKGTEWGSACLNKQWEFYQKYLSHSTEKIAVIISDALRYECGDELVSRLDQQFKAKSTMSSAISVLPSYTSLGVAALLPYNEMKYTDTADVVLDGISIASYEGREKVLNGYKNSKVYKAEDFMNPKLHANIKAEVKGTEVIYIYHNKIDAVGDHVPTELEVFDAAERCFEELGLIFQRLQNLSVYNVIITADHGFLYRREDIRLIDKTPKEIDTAVKSKRRFIVSHGQPVSDLTRTVSLDYLISETDLTVQVPYGNNIFARQGESAKFVHGGDSLQETVIPIIIIENKKKNRDKNAARTVTVKLVSISRKITSLITFLEFFQNEQVSDKIISKSIEVFFEDSVGNQITNSVVIECDSKSDDIKDRTFKEKFTFKNKQYNRDEQYFMIIKDYNDSYAEREKIPFTIDILISNDFRF